MQVLVVDDDPTTLFISSTVIQRIDDADPITMGDPMEALSWLRHSTPDLILIDQNMPGLDGMDLLRETRRLSHLADVPIVMITGDASQALRLAALEEGCTDFLTKPISLPELQARARNLLRMQHTQRLLKDHAATLRQRVDEASELLRDQAQELVHRLSSAAEFRDPETGTHLLRMAHYSKLIAQRLDLDPDVCDELFHAAPMHDIGKIGIPDAILVKPGRLTAEEFQLMKRHTLIGHSILEGSRYPLIVRAAEIALAHHEKVDGSGYPHGLSGDAIPLSCRIVAVADVFDALTTARPYKRPWPLDDARTYLFDQRGTHFDPACVDVFLDGWQEVCAIYESFPETEETTPHHL